jgi:DNA-binding GntR family transcriptional regulator
MSEMPLPQSTAKVARTLAREEVYTKLQDWVIDGTLAPSEVLHDARIAQLFGVSRTPVREALRRLEDEGLVETALNRWTRVAPVDLAATSEVYSIIEVLETFALQAAFTELRPQDLSQMRAANRAMREAGESGNVAAAIVGDEAFHQVWLARLGNVELLVLMARLKAKVRRAELCYFGEDLRTRESYREHAAIYKAIQQERLQDAIEALRANWRGSLARLRHTIVSKETRE